MADTDKTPKPFRKSRRHVLLAVSALAVAFVRHVLQYGEYNFGGSLVVAGVSWFLSYCAIALIAAAAVGLAEHYQNFYFGSAETPPKLELTQTIYLIAFIALVAALAVFAIAHWPTDTNAIEN